VWGLSVVTYFCAEIGINTVETLEFVVAQFSLYKFVSTCIVFLWNSCDLPHPGIYIFNMFIPKLSFLQIYKILEIISP
jgi:hypothetical protein